VYLFERCYLIGNPLSAGRRRDCGRNSAELERRICGENRATGATTDDDVTNYVHSDEKAQNNDANWPPLMGRSATTPDSGKCDMQPLYLGGFVRAHCGEFVA